MCLYPNIQVTLLDYFLDFLVMFNYCDKKKYKYKLVEDTSKCHSYCFRFKSRKFTYLFFFYIYFSKQTTDPIPLLFHLVP